MRMPTKVELVELAVAGVACYVVLAHWKLALIVMGTAVVMCLLCLAGVSAILYLTDKNGEK